MSGNDTPLAGRWWPTSALFMVWVALCSSLPTGWGLVASEARASAAPLPRARHRSSLLWLPCCNRLGHICSI
jgi:hypothetical protein